MKERKRVEPVRKFKIMEPPGGEIETMGEAIVDHGPRRFSPGWFL